MIRSWICLSTWLAFFIWWSPRESTWCMRSFTVVLPEQQLWLLKSPCVNSLSWNWTIHKYVHRWLQFSNSITGELRDETLPARLNSVKTFSFTCGQMSQCVTVPYLSTWTLHPDTLYDKKRALGTNHDEGKTWQTNVHACRRKKNHQASVRSVLSSVWA